MKDIPSERDQGLRLIALEIARLRQMMLLSFAIFAAMGFIIHQHPSPSDFSLTALFAAAVILFILAIVTSRSRARGSR